MGAGSNFKLRLFVAGQSANSVQAIANLEQICRAYLPDQHEIELIDVLREPEKGLEAKIFLTPTLLKLSPLPTIKIHGNLSNTPIVLQALGLTPPAR